MSTKTNFKRIALVAVAALGLGVLSSVPSQAVSNVVVTVSTNGTTAAGQSDSTTAATISITGTTDDVRDTITVSFVGNGTLGDSVTAGVAGEAQARLIYLDTLTASRSRVSSDQDLTNYSAATKLDSKTATQTYAISGSSYGNIGAKFGIQLDSATAQVAGTYSFTVFVKQYSYNVSNPVSTPYTVNVVSAAPASASATASAATSTAVLKGLATWAGNTTDSTSVTIAAPSSTTPGASVKIDLLNAASGQASVKDSITVSIDKGNVSIQGNAAYTTPQGKSLAAYSYTGSTAYVHIYPDGSTGLATLTIATKNAGSFTKTVTFYGTDYKSIVASQYRSVIPTSLEGSSKGAIKVNAYDVNSVSYGAATTVYAYSSDTSVVSDYGTLCTWNTTDSAAYCKLTGVKAGSATITIRDAATVATSTVASNAVSVRVSASTATSADNTFTLTTDKASYAPGEKGYLIVTVKDKSGAVVPAVTSDTAIFASGGISTNGQLGNSSDTLTATTFQLERTSTPSSVDPVKVYTFYAPAAAGTVTFSAKGASTFSAASQATATTATITVADNASAALAAVSALAVTVASLKTLITTLTNLVLKIQKKVKA